MAKRAATSLPCLVDEFYAAPLGNRLRNRRLEQIVPAVCRSPGHSFPKMFGSEADLEGFYRFIRNGRYSAADIMEPHVQQTCERIAVEKTVIIAHDTTEFAFCGDAEPEGLG